MLKQKPIRYLTLMVVVVAAAIGAASCSSSEPQELNFRIAVQAGQPVGGVQTLEAKQGDTIRLRYETDETANFHIHGYDIETEVVAGRQRIETFVAETTGRFEIELEDLEETVGFLQVQPR